MIGWQAGFESWKRPGQMVVQRVRELGDCPLQVLQMLKLMDLRHHRERQVLCHVLRAFVCVVLPRSFLYLGLLN